MINEMIAWAKSKKRKMESVMGGRGASQSSIEVLRKNKLKSLLTYCVRRT